MGHVDGTTNRQRAWIPSILFGSNPLIALIVGITYLIVPLYAGIVYLAQQSKAMGNCKSTSAAADSVVAVHHQKGEGYAGASAVTTHKKPVVQIQIDGSVEVPHGTLVLSPTADLSEATSKDSHDGNPRTVVTRCSVDEWIGTKPTIDEEEVEVTSVVREKRKKNSVQFFCHSRDDTPPRLRFMRVLYF